MFLLFVILFFLLLSLCLVLFNSFSHLSLQTSLSFIHLTSRSLFRFTFIYSAFSILQKCYFVFAFSIGLKHAAVHIERFRQTCMTKEETEMLMLMNHPLLGRCCTGPCVVCIQTVTIILRNLILTLKFQIVLARSYVGIVAHFLYQMKEDEQYILTMEIMFYK